MKLITGTALVTFLAAPAVAQQTIDELFGTAPGDRFGAALAFVGDLDGDGLEDFAVGVPGDDSAGAAAGRVSVFSGADRSLLFHRDGLLAGGRLGESVDVVGDLDGDAVNDLVAGAPGVSQVLVFSGADGTILYGVAPSAGADFGSAVAGIGLADADAWPDFAVGATAGTGLWVFSGRTGGLHWSDPTVALELGDLGDVDGDGFGDLIAGDYTWNGHAGRAVVFSGLSGAVVRQHLGDNTFQDQLGKGVSGLGDVDGDGVGDYGYGVPCNCFASHYAVVRSGASGGLIHTLSEYTIGWDLAPGGDLDLDGTPDVLVSEPGLIYAYGGADGSELFAHGSAQVVDGGADADGDGFVDFLGGAPWDATNGPNAGRVSLYTLGCPPGAVSSYCTAVANSTGQRAQMGWQNTTSIANNDFRLSAEKCPPDKPGLFFYGTAPTELPVGEGHLCVTGATFRLPVVSTGPGGTPSWTVDFTSPPNAAGQISAGETWYFSFWFRDPPGGPAGFNFADGLRVTFCP